MEEIQEEEAKVESVEVKRERFLKKYQLQIDKDAEVM